MKNSIRKSISMAACLAIMLCLCACSNNVNLNDTNNQKESEVKDQTKKAGSYTDLSNQLHENHLVSYTVDIPSVGARSYRTGYSTSIGENKLIIFDKYMEFSHDDFGYSLDVIQTDTLRNC